MGGRGAKAGNVATKGKTAQTNQWKGRDLEFRNQMFGRLVSDVRYFLGNGNGSERNLWAGDVESHIKELKNLYSTFTAEQKSNLKTTAKDINDYAKRMRALKKSNK